jgi:hypothetical protein
MATLRRWSTSASGNATVTGGVNTINFAEGQTPGSVNNSAREMMAQVRSIYTPSEWGWVEHSATASVASQTAFKLGGNQTTNWTAGRRWRLKSGSTTRYGSVVSSSFTAETTITVTVDSGSLSASHSLAALAGIDSNHTPAFAAGSASAPSIIPNGDTNTGFWFPAADTIAASTGGSERLRITSGGDVGIGATPVNKLDVAGALRSTGVTTPTSGAGIEMFYSADVGYIIPYDRTAAAFKALQIQTLECNIFGGGTNRLKVDSSGNILNVSTGGLGYGTGSGGTVTQITSKSTGVTLNKTNGLITMNAAALAAGATVSFTVTNSTMAAADLVIVNCQSGYASAGAYRVQAETGAAGSFQISLTNTTGGSLSEAVAVKFAIIKAVTS